MFDGSEFGPSVVEWIEKVELVCKMCQVKHPEHTDHGIYTVGDAVWVKTLHGWCSTQSKKWTVTGVYSPHLVLINETSHHIRDLCLGQRSASSEDDSSDKSSESDSNTLLFFSTGPDNSYVKPEETDSEDDNDDARNEGDQVGTTREETGRSHPFTKATDISMSFMWSGDQGGV